MEDIIDRYNLTALKQKRYMPRTLDRCQALEVITRPCPDMVDSESAEFILDKMVQMSRHKGEVDPAILSLMMSELFDIVQREGRQKIDYGLVSTFSGDIIKNFYVRGVKEISTRARRFIESNLVTSDGRRRFVTQEEIRINVTESEIEGLLSKKILHCTSNGKSSDYELSHDALCLVVLFYKREWIISQNAVKIKRTILSLSVITVVFVVIVGSIVSSNEKRRSAEIRSSLISKENDSIAKLNFSLKAQNDSIILLYLRVERDAIEMKHKNDSIEEMKNAIRKEAEAIRLRDTQILVQNRQILLKNLELEEKDDSLRINLLLNEKRVKQLEERIKELESTKNSFAIPKFGF